MTDAIDVVRAQVDAFNAKDLDGFVGTYAPHATVTGVSDAPLNGADEIRAFYEPRLQDHSLFCTLQTVLLLGGRWVVAQELIGSDAGTSETMATFEVLDGVITRASMLKA